MTHHKLANEEELREKLYELYNESIQMGRLRMGSPIEHMVNGSLKLLTSEIEKAKVEAVTEFLNGFKDWPIEIQRNRGKYISEYIDKYLMELSKLQEDKDE